MDSIRIGAAFHPPAESEASGPAATKPEVSVPSAPKSTATGNEAQLFHPTAGDEVLVSFEHGDPRAPYLIGGLWNAEAPPTSATALAKSSDGTQPGAAAEPGSDKDKWLSQEQGKLISGHLRTSK